MAGDRNQTGPTRIKSLSGHVSTEKGRGPFYPRQTVAILKENKSPSGGKLPMCNPGSVEWLTIERGRLYLRDMWRVPQYNSFCGRHVLRRGNQTPKK